MTPAEMAALEALSRFDKEIMNPVNKAKKALSKDAKFRIILKELRKTEIPENVRETAHVFQVQDNMHPATALQAAYKIEGVPIPAIHKLAIDEMAKVPDEYVPVIQRQLYFNDPDSVIHNYDAEAFSNQWDIGWNKNRISRGLPPYDEAKLRKEAADNSNKKKFIDMLLAMELPYGFDM